jgi:hypothetical protein
LRWRIGIFSVEPVFRFEFGHGFLFGLALCLLSGEGCCVIFRLFSLLKFHLICPSHTSKVARKPYRTQTATETPNPNKNR